MVGLVRLVMYLTVVVSVKLVGIMVSVNFVMRLVSQKIAGCRADAVRCFICFCKFSWKSYRKSMRIFRSYGGCHCS